MDDSYVSSVGKPPLGLRDAYVLFYVREKGDALLQAINSTASSSKLAPSHPGAPSKKRRIEVNEEEEDESIEEEDEEEEVPEQVASSSSFKQGSKQNGKKQPRSSTDSSLSSASQPTQHNSNGNGQSFRGKKHKKANLKDPYGVSRGGGSGKFSVQGGGGGKKLAKSLKGRK